MTDSVRDSRLREVEIRLLKLAEHLTQTIVSAAPDQASYLSSALRPVTSAMSLVQKARQAPADVSQQVLQQASEHLSPAFAALESGRAAAAATELKSIARDLEGLTAA